jgi:hypothetical protein
LESCFRRFSQAADPEVAAFVVSGESGHPALRYSLDQKLTQKLTWNRVFVVFRKLLILKLLHLLFLESGHPALRYSLDQKLTQKLARTRVFVVFRKLLILKWLQLLFLES